MEFMGMHGGEDWLFRPVMHGLCKYESLIDGTLGLHDIGLLNEAIDIDGENRRRLERAHRGK